MSESEQSLNLTQTYYGSVLKLNTNYELKEKKKE